MNKGGSEVESEVEVEWEWKHITIYALIKRIFNSFIGAAVNHFTSLHFTSSKQKKNNFSFLFDFVSFLLWNEMKLIKKVL